MEQERLSTDWIDKIAKTKEEKAKLFNEYLRVFNFHKISIKKLFEGEGYYVMMYRNYDRQYPIKFSDFDVDLCGLVLALKKPEYFADAWSRLISSKLDENDKVEYMAQYNTAYKPYVQHLQEIEDYAENW